LAGDARSKVSKQQTAQRDAVELEGFAAWVKIWSVAWKRFLGSNGGPFEFFELCGLAECFPPDPLIAGHQA